MHWVATMWLQTAEKAYLIKWTVSVHSVKYLNAFQYLWWTFNSLVLCCSWSWCCLSFISYWYTIWSHSDHILMHLVTPLMYFFYMRGSSWAFSRPLSQTPWQSKQVSCSDVINIAGYVLIHPWLPPDPQGTKTSMALPVGGGPERGQTNVAPTDYSQEGQQQLTFKLLPGLAPRGTPVTLTQAGYSLIIIFFFYGHHRVFQNHSLSDLLDRTSRSWETWPLVKCSLTA